MPWLTSLYHDQYAGNYGNRQYPGNCSGNLIRDLLFFFQPQSVFDPMTGGGTCKDVCDSLGIPCVSGDLKTGLDITNPKCLPQKETFDFVWLHPPYWRMIDYKAGDNDLSAARDLAAFRGGLSAAVFNCLSVLNPGGKIAILMGDYNDRDAGFVPLTQLTKNVCVELGLRQAAPTSSGFRTGPPAATGVIASSFIPGLHDVCMIFERKDDVDPQTGEISAA